MPTRLRRTIRSATLAALAALLLAACQSVGPAGESAPADAAAHRGAHAADWRDEVIYFAFTDRFRNGDPSNDDGVPGAADDAEPDNPLGWHGGDFAGIAEKIREGYFERLGITALWISPVPLQVPAFPVDDPNSPNDGRDFAGYHGYWADNFFAVDPHFGTLAELRRLVRVAHARDL